MCGLFAMVHDHVNFEHVFSLSEEIQEKRKPVL